VVFGVIATFFLLVSFRNVKENISITEERMTLKRAWVSLRANRPWFVFAINIFLMWGRFSSRPGRWSTSSIITSAITISRRSSPGSPPSSPAGHPHRAAARQPDEKAPRLSGRQRDQPGRHGHDDGGRR
jgi:hypothetical protein